MGSSDEEEMRRVRTGRGFQTRMGRAAAAAERATAAGGGGTAGAMREEEAAAAAEAGAAAAATLRRAARRATAEDPGSSSSSEDEHEYLHEGRREAAAAARAAVKEPGSYEGRSSYASHDMRRRAGRVDTAAVENTATGETATAGEPAAASQAAAAGEDAAAACFVAGAAARKRQLGVKRPTFTFELHKQPTPSLLRAALDTSSDDEDCLGPRPLATTRFSPSSEEAESPGSRCSSSSSCERRSGSSSRRNSSSKSTGSSSSRIGSGKEEVRRGEGGEGLSLHRKTNAPETAVADAAAEAAPEAPATSFKPAFVWKWKSGARPSGVKGGSTEEEETEQSDAECKQVLEGEEEEGKEEEEGEQGRREEEDVDFLFDQVPEEEGEEEDTSTTECGTPGQPERQQPGKQQLADTRRRPAQSESACLGHAQGGKHEDEQEEKEGEGREALQKAKDPQKEQERRHSADKRQPLEQETNQQSGKKWALQQGNAERRGEGSERGVKGEDEEEVEDMESERERSEMGLPRAFGCGAGAATADACAARNARVKRVGRDGHRDAAGGRSLEEGRISGEGAATDEDDDEAAKWRSLGLPVSLQVDIPAHTPARVSALAVNLKANRMATGGSDGFVRLWDFQGLHLENLRSYRNFCPAEKHKVEALAFSFRNDLLLVAAGDAVCRVYTAQAAELVHTTTRGDMYIRDAANTKGHTHTVLDCCWHPLQAQQFFSCGLDATVRLWDLNARPYGILQTLPHVTCFKTVPSSTGGSGRAAAGNRLRSSSSDACTCFVVAPTAAECLVVGCADGSLQLWGSLGSRRVFGRPDAIVRDAHSASPVTVASAGGGIRSSSSSSHTDASAAAPTAPAASRGGVGGMAERAAGVSVCVAVAQRRAAAAPVDPGVQSGAGGSGPGKGQGVSGVHFFSDDRRLVSRGEDGSVAMWDIRNFKQPTARASLLLSAGDSGRGGVCLSPDEKYVCVTLQGGTSGDVTAGPAAAGAVQVLRADELSLVAALPIGAAANSSAIAGSGTSSGATAGAAAGGQGGDLQRAGTATQVKEEAERDSTGSDRDSSSGSRASGRRQARQPLRVLWPSETNQLLVSCTDGCVCVLFDREMSRKGVLLCVDAAKGSRRRQATEQEAAIMYTQPYVLVPGQLPEGFKETRDGQIIRVKPRGRERQRLFLEKQKTLIPPIPAKEGYAGANVGGGNRSQHLLRQLGLLNPPAAPGEGDDPVAALRAYAEKVESSGRESQLISRAYAATQPHAVLEFDAEEEEAALAAGVASGAVEDSGRLLQQKTRCPRCALRMCQCGYIEEQNAAANPSSNKRQRV